VGTAAITRDDVREMSASYVRVEAGKSWRDRVPDGSDCYLFVLAGSGTITSDGARHTISRESFATIQEGQGFAVENNGTAALERGWGGGRPRPSAAGAFPAFTENRRLAKRPTPPIHDTPAENKRRISFAGPGAALPERAHAMIVIYAKDTIPRLHHHPNAES